MQASLYMFMLTVAIGQLLVGPLADRFGRRRVALGTAILFLQVPFFHRWLLLSQH